MKALEEIKARLAAATPGPWELANPRPDGRNMVQRRGYDLYGDEVSEMIIVDTNPSDAEFIAHSPETQAKLTAALEAVQALMKDHATRSRATSDRLNQQVVDRAPDQDAAAASRFAAYAATWESAQLMVHAAIAEALR